MKPDLLLAQQTLAPNFYGGGTVNQSPWWNVFCGLATDPGCSINANPAAIIGILLPNVLIMAGVIFFGLILFGGFSLISTAGKDSSPQDKAKGSAAVTYGVIGFLLVVSAYFILQIIGTVTGVNFISPVGI